MQAKRHVHPARFAALAQPHLASLAPQVAHATVDPHDGVLRRSPQVNAAVVEPRVLTHALVGSLDVLGLAGGNFGFGA